MRSVVLALGLLACGSAGTGSGAPDTSAPEICDNGVDDDGDALLDCEDEECATDSACEEVCDNDLDDDGDGLIDCEDAYCWGTGCSVAWLQLTSASGAVFQEREAFRPDGTCGTYVDAPYTWPYLDFSAHDLEGTLRFINIGHPATYTCTWTADRIALHAYMTTESFYSPDLDLASPDLVETEGLVVQAGCTQQQPTFPVDRVFEGLDRVVLNEQAGEVHLSIDGQLWSRFPGPLTTSTRTYSTTSSSWYSCVDRTYWQNGRRDFPTVVGGYDVFIAL